MKSLIIISLVSIALLLSCNSTPKESTSFAYSTTSDSALWYFNTGWKEIMDNGRWTLAEEAFRKSIEFDDSFLIGLSLVGRISSDIGERKQILKILELGKDEVKGPERQLLDIYKSNIESMNLREESPNTASSSRSRRRIQAESKFRSFVSLHSNQDYVLAEYIEVLRAIHGPQQALDSLNAFVTQDQLKQTPFFTRYQASLNAEQAHYEKALSLAQKFDKMLSDPTLPEPYVLYADIYIQMDSLEKAHTCLQTAIKLDSNHLIAQSLKEQIKRRLELQTTH